MINIHNILIPFLNHFRSKRMQDFEKLFQLNNNTKILDVGGSRFNWQFIHAKPKVTILNLSKPKEWEGNNQFVFVVGDATTLKFSDNSFDIAYSNSVIEHLYTKENQIKMANEILRVGKRIYVQTPAREFFIEPHLLTPFIHWLPKKLQSKLMRNFTIWGIITRPSQDYIDKFLNERRLLSYNEIKTFFPDCTIYKEKFLGMTKSYIVIK